MQAALIMRHTVLVEEASLSMRVVDMLESGDGAEKATITKLRMLMHPTGSDCLRIVTGT